ncbi:MAG: hypothetical protein PHD47_04545 [Acholeplasmataceae bacterium]|nr:hypothetical protein [Acholeplasmataceae bacterium]
MNLLIALSDTNYYIVSGFLVILVLLGLFLMSKVKYARLGNFISALSVFGAVIIT